MHIEGKGPGPSNPGNQSTNPLANVDLSQADDIICENPECGGTIFEEKLKIKKISKFLTGSDRDSILPIPVIVCAKCHHINEMFKPQV